MSQTVPQGVTGGGGVTHVFRPRVSRPAACFYPVLVLIPLAAETDRLPAFHLSTVFTAWGADPVLITSTSVIAGLYLLGVWTLHSRGDKWPVGRTAAFVVGGTGSFYFATSSGIGTYDDTLLSVHMVQHMILGMVVPLFLALGAPVTLALRTLPRGPRAGLLAVLHSRVAKVLTFAPLTLALYVVSPWALYFSGWYSATLHSDFQHEMMHVHLVVVGSLFFWPLMGIDPLPNRLGYPVRMLIVVLTLPFHAFLGITILGQSKLIGGNWYPDLHATMPWLPAPLDDQHLAGGILWSSGDLIGLLFFGVLFVQWVRSSIKEGQREDRRLDRLERLEQAQARRPTPGAPD
ncbi:MAG: cytochrome c oxidase assembly protein [Marmoricola sp.]|nr:cytochrome c oxidase assembly protein [Marmoricola sp.]